MKLRALQSRVAVCCLLLGALLTSMACRPAEPGHVISLGEDLVFEGAAFAVPGSRWRVKKDTGAWFFRGHGQIQCVVAEEGLESLQFVLQASGPARYFAFRYFWDGQELPPTAVQRDEGNIIVELPAPLLERGQHEFVVKRQYQHKKVRQNRILNNTFERLAYRVGEREVALPASGVDRWRLIAEFLQHGVVGPKQGRWSGLLFTLEGSDYEHEVEVPENFAGGALEVGVRNFATQPAKFSLRIGGGSQDLEVAAGGEGQLAVDAAAGEAVTLSVESQGAGEYLWAMPRFEPEVQKPQSPVILITMDTTRRDALGAYGQPAGVTPHLDEFAAAATVYEQAFTTAPWTLPSHASMFTGLYPSRHRAGVDSIQLPAGTTTLASLLRQNGYTNGGFSAGELSSSRFGLGQGFHYYRNPDQWETIGDRVLSYVEEFLQQHGDRPFFVFANFFDPHAAYRAPAEFEERFGVAELRRELVADETWRAFAKGEPRAWRAAVEGDLRMSPEAITFIRAAYQAEVAFVDSLLGQLFARLKEMDVYDESLIIITADHGEMLGERGFVSHSGLVDPELIAVPMLVKFPGQQEGERVPQLASVVDLFPTVLEAVGIEAPASDGLPLLRASEGTGTNHRFVVFEEHESLVHPLPGYMKIANHVLGIQQIEQRQVVWQDGQLCARLEGDTWVDVECTADREKVLASLEAQLKRARLAESDPSAEEVMSDELRRSLEALGYL